MTTESPNATLQARMWARGVTGLLPIALLLYLGAGRLDYWQGWVYLGLNVLVVLLTVWALAANPALIEERLRPGKGMKRWDKWYFAISTLAYFGSLTVAALDAGRFGWTQELSVSVYAAGLATYALGQAIFLWAKWTNQFFSSVVRIQTERGHTLCQDGPYRLVRHPGYVGGIVFGLSTPLLLGSLWALIPAAIAALSLVVRTHLEDKTLRRELPGYEEYVQQVKYRLLPGVW
jgi:protein-S-isoprenylcysteine O-methyltransferase Ste14